MSTRIAVVPNPHPAAGIDSLPFGLAWRRLAWVGTAGLVLMLVVQSASRYLVWTEASYGPMWINRPWVLAHFVGGAIALAAGLVQFSSTLRRRHPAVHRWTGRTYLVGVAIGATAAYALSLRAVLGWPFGVATFVMGTVWVGATAMAFIAIRNRRIDAHREWMLRSYVVALAFVFFRLMAVSPLLAGMGSKPERLTALIWLSWTVPLFVAEVLLQWRRGLARHTTEDSPAGTATGAAVQPAVQESLRASVTS